MIDNDALHQIYVNARNTVERGWIQGQAKGERRHMGNPTQDPEGVCFLGGLWESVFRCHDLRTAEWWRIRNHTEVHLAKSRGVQPGEMTRWNDDPMRTKAEVLELLDELIAQTAPLPAVPAIEVREEEKEEVLV
jgi:hypothetical protein